MPLLHPARENLPFGVALELWDGNTSWRAGNLCARQELKSSELYEVDYVLYGKGKVCVFSISPCSHSQLMWENHYLLLWTKLDNRDSTSVLLQI